VSDNLSDEERDFIALNLVPGIGSRLTTALLERFGSVAQALRAPMQELREIPHLSTKVAQELARASGNPDIAKEAEQIHKHGVHLRLRGRSGYPGNLATIPDPPHLLYVRGTLEASDEKAVAIVGSRACTTYGKRLAERIAHDLARAGWTVVSGLARGIDGCAHRGALQAKGRTLAVLAGGLSKIYPPEHAGLAAEVAASGAILTESSMRMESMANLFPPRNRIISGLSRAIVVIEAADKSGALITARQAAEQGREVFAVPGQVDSEASAGTLQLLRDGAKLVRHADDILEDLQFLPGFVEAAAAPRQCPRAPQPAPPPPSLDPAEQKIWDALAERRSVDQLAEQLEFPITELTGRLMMMELKKAVRRLPGNCYERF
jgi:DNA processing protein